MANGEVSEITLGPRLLRCTERVQLRGEGGKTQGEYVPLVGEPPVPWDPSITEEESARWKAGPMLTYDELKSRLGWERPSPSTGPSNSSSPSRNWRPRPTTPPASARRPSGSNTLRRIPTDLGKSRASEKSACGIPMSSASAFTIIETLHRYGYWPSGCRCGTDPAGGFATDAVALPRTPERGRPPLPRLGWCQGSFRVRAALIVSFHSSPSTKLAMACRGG